MGSTTKDYYRILGVPKDAGADEIRAAYRRLALKHHPDRNKGDKAAEERFKEIGEAYEVLSSPEKRAFYDEGGPSATGWEAGNGFRPQGFDGFDDVFSDLFSGREEGPHAGGREGADLQVDHRVTLREAFTGSQASLRLRRTVACGGCGGTGARNGDVRNCPACGGAGVIQTSRGFLTLRQTCPHCEGKGAFNANPCRDCRGRGTVERTETVKVRIPAGVMDNTTLRVPGAGEAGERGGPAGDLYVVVHVEPDPRFTREGDDLVTGRRVSIPLAALGGEIEAPTPGEPVRFRVPPGAQPGTVLRVRDAGMPRLGGGRGDLLVRLDLEVPRRLTDEQRRLFVELAESMGESGQSENF